MSWYSVQTPVITHHLVFDAQELEYKLEKLLDVILHETNVYDITCTFQGYNGIEWTLNRILN